jgi:hypothetical protein
MAEDKRQPIRLLIRGWKADVQCEKGYIPLTERRAALVKLFQTLKMNGYTDAEEVDVYRKEIIEQCCPNRNTYRGNMQAFRTHVERDYDIIFKEIYLKHLLAETPKEVVIEKSSLPQVVVEETFQRVSIELDRSLISTKGLGAAKYNPDKEICDLLGVPEDHRE